MNKMFSTCSIIYQEDKIHLLSQYYHSFLLCYWQLTGIMFQIMKVSQKHKFLLGYLVIDYDLLEAMGCSKSEDLEPYY